MKIKDHKGFKRLSVLITLLSFVISYIFFIVIENNPNEEEVFMVFPIIAALIAIMTFIFVRIIYWVIDGFKNEG